MRSERAALAAMVVATLLWGATFVVIRDSLGDLDPLALVAMRFLAAAIAFSALFAARGRPPARGAWAGGIAVGACGAGGFLFQAIGLTATSAGSSAFLTSAGTLLAGLFAWPLLGQRPGPVLLAGMAVALAGSALLVPPGALGWGAGERWTLLGAACFGLQIVAIARWAARTDALALVAIQSVTITALLLPFAGPAFEQLAGLAPAGWARFGYLALAGSVIAPLLQVLAQRTLPAGRVALLFTLEPVFALLFALTLGAERFDARWYAGATLILLAVVGVEGWAARPRRATR